ncbi:delta-like protein B isoform X3 [Varroa destructor]|uniref:Delta-like protein n=1 Tax=Varroa destructor TaxID=109461 RepID=A0A7M7JWJ8_VARDE|nr:delta-like protein B isoform X3 [Varroa destructor]
MMTIPSVVGCLSAVIFVTASFLQSAIASGVFQLKVESLNMTKELSRQDVLRLRICWSHFQREINADNMTCTYGESISAPLSLPYPANSFEVSMPFDFGWPGTFALVVEAWLESKVPTSAPALRLTSSQFLAISQEWSKPDLARSPVKIAFRAVCSAHYYGIACDRLCRPRNDRFGHYECDEEGNKVCTRGWAGEYCDKPVCRPGCKGSCSKPFGCDCHFGYEGAMCDQCVRFPGCKHGSCNQPWQCNCDEGWGGMLCNRDLNFCTNNAPCRNGGTCLNSGDGRYTCKCPIGFGGKNCEQVIKGCAALPCMNGGTCKEVSNTTDYSCRCREGFFGVHCEFRNETCDTKKCENSATCRNTISGPQCICPQGFDGPNCEHKINPCDGNPCMNGGRCTNGEKPYADAPFRCTCPEGFYGHRCEIRDHCQPNPCSNGATCQSHGDGFKCFCRKGFTGANCTVQVDHCVLKPCANGGTCFSRQNDFECACPSGFSGKDCSLNVDECKPNPCKNGGQCTDLIDGYKCTCKPSFTGANCEYSMSYKYGAYGSKLKQIPEADVVTAAQKATILTLGILLVISIALGAVAYYRKYRPNQVAMRQNKENSARAAAMMNNSIYRSGGRSDSLMRNSLRPGDVGSLRYSMTPGLIADPCGAFVRPQPKLPSPAIKINDELKNNNKTLPRLGTDAHVYATVHDYVDGVEPQFSRYSVVRGSGLYSNNNNNKVLNTRQEENHYENVKKANPSSGDLKADLKAKTGGCQSNKSANFVCSAPLKNNNNTNHNNNNNNNHISNNTSCNNSSSHHAVHNTSSSKICNEKSAGANSSKLSTQV